MTVPEESKTLHNFDLYSDPKLIGRGGSGAVYRVVRDGQKFAMKIPMQYNPVTEKTVERPPKDIVDKFRKEKDNLIKLTDRCPDSVVRIEDYGTSPFPWIVLEYADADFRKHIDDGKATIGDIISLLNRLDGIHKADLYHFDIKPENIMRVGKTWKFTDFGSSKSINYVTTTATKENFVGTYMYSAPEQFSPKKYGKRDQRTDIWQMGAVLYEILAKRKPYDVDDIMELVEVIKNGGPDLKYVPKGYQGILARVFQPDKEKRYQSAVEFARDLEHVSDKGGTGILLNVPPEPVISGDVFLDITDPRGGRICKGLRSGTERGTITELDIPNGVIKILDNAFKGCGSLRTVTIPDTVTDIDYGSFKGCVSLESVTIPGSVKVIGDYAFESCRSLKEITFSGPVEIGHHAFKGCDLDEKTERRLKELAGSDERYRDIVGKRSG